jgi:hypothetical protein
VKDVRSGALEGELAAAILLAKLGTVPRALALAKIDRIALINELGTLARGRHSYC